MLSPSPDFQQPSQTRAIVLLAVAGFASQAMVRSADSILPQIAHDLSVTIGAASIAVWAYSLVHGSMQLVIGPLGDRYGKPMMITENGIATRNDNKRIWYMRNHLAAIGRAIRDGYDVRGYFAWSLADNYEWHYGYKALFGLAQMDPETYDRVFKPSARKFAEIIRQHPTVGSVRNIEPQKDF